MKTEKTELALPSRLESINEAAAHAAQIAAENGMDEAVLFGIDLAVREAVANAVKHGNKFDETKTVKVAFEISPESLIIEIEDQGTGFNVEQVPDPTNAENLMKDTGRGILFMHNFMDAVEWRAAASGGTIVRLVKNV